MFPLFLEILKPISKSTYFRYQDKTKNTLTKPWSVVSGEIKLILLVSCIKTLSLMAFHLCPISDIMRVVLFDFLYLWNIDSQVYMVSLIVCLPVIYISYIIYFNSKCIPLQRWANQYPDLILHKSVAIPQSRWQLKLKVLNKVKTRYLGFSETMILHLTMVGNKGIQVFGGIVAVSLEFILLRHIWLYHYLKPHFVWIVLLSHFNAFLCAILAFLASHTTHIVSILLMTTTVCLFRRLDHTNQLVRRTGKINFLNRGYLRYSINHTFLLCEVIRINGFVSRMYCMAVFALIPSNAFMLMTMLIGKFSRDVLAYVILFVVTEILIQIAAHTLLASYHKKLHQATPQLFSLSITHRKDFARNLRAHLDLEQHISKFHTNNPYGITCGSFGLVTNKSLIKTIFYYFKILFFVYHFWNP